MNDKDFLQQAIEVGNQVPAPHNFGAVIVKDGQAIAAEHNHVAEQNNPSLHSEICAIVAACKKLGTYYLEGATLYASHEPCAMCLSCAAWAHIDRIAYVTSAIDQNFSYEFKNPDIKALAQDLVRPMTIDHIALD